MVQQVRALDTQARGTELGSKHPDKKLVMAMCTGNPMLWGWRHGSQRLAGSQPRSGFRERHCLKE